ncbi:dTDP-4-dehydrorhamnose 3,5-epimerase family protein [Streptomyces sp. DT24]|uniref:dTDP-4-dehydrorhamnose 3,5-epimerase family protein n=1 Tax=unclassified Streptomyces TaxID=2593676 RepID=UPI003CF9C672
MKIEGAWEFTPQIFRDPRGVFLSPYQEQAFTEAIGHPLFPVAQSSYSMSQRGVVRGIHFTHAPPGMAKYAYCSRGSATDYVIDTRLGSPTFGMWDSVQLAPETRRSVYLPVGVGHLFVSLEDDTTVSYLLSTGYVAEQEHSINPTDPDVALRFPESMDIILSDRDRTAPTLAEAKAAGILPDYAESLRLEARLTARTGESE